MRAVSRRRLPRLVYDYIEGGGGDELTLARNRRDLDALLVRQRVFRDVSRVDVTTRLFGQPTSLPIALAPVGLGGAMARRAEALAASAAAKAGAPVCHAAFSICAIEEVTRAAGGVAPWLQIYPLDDDDAQFQLLDRARVLGTEVLVLTVDVPVPGVRPREARRPPMGRPGLANGASRLWDGISHPGWLYNTWWRGGPLRFANFHNMRHPLSIIATPDYVARIRDRWPGKLVIKGVLDPEDARLACTLGADGLVISNHGGRQLDTAPSTISVLPSILKAVDGAMPVLVDSGIASGLDVMKALALGAQGCLVGRLWAHAVAAGGEEGVALMLARLKRELSTAMALAGQTQIPDLTPEILHMAP